MNHLPAHLVPRHDILSLMSVLVENNMVADNDFVRELHDKLERITEQKPDSLKEKLQ